MAKKGMLKRAPWAKVPQDPLEAAEYEIADIASQSWQKGKLRGQLAANKLDRKIEHFVEVITGKPRNEIQLDRKQWKQLRTQVIELAKTRGAAPQEIGLTVASTVEGITGEVSPTASRKLLQRQMAAIPAVARGRVSKARKAGKAVGELKAAKGGFTKSLVKNVGLPLLAFGAVDFIQGPGKEKARIKKALESVEPLRMPTPRDAARDMELIMWLRKKDPEMANMLLGRLSMPTGAQAIMPRSEVGFQTLAAAQQGRGNMSPDLMALLNQ